MRWLLRQCALVATFDDAGTELPGGDVLVDGREIAAVGHALPADGCDRVIDGTGLVVLPGLINAHQHLYQGATRAIPSLERALTMYGSTTLRPTPGGPSRRCPAIAGPQWLSKPAARST